MINRLFSTERLYVRHLQGADYGAFSKVIDHAISQDRFNKKLVANHSLACLAVCGNDDHRFVGRCGFRITTDGTRVEPEIFLLPEEQNNRLGSELFKAMILYCRAQFAGYALAASIKTSNKYAKRLLSDNNFKDSGETVLLKSGWHAVYTKQPSCP